MPRFPLLLSATLLVTAVPAQLEWPGFRGPSRDGVARDAAPPLEWSDDKNIAWKLALPGPGSSSPVVDGDHVYVACYTGYGIGDDPGKPEDLRHHVLCVDRATGKEVWRRTFAGKLPGPARPMQLREHGFASPTPVTDGKTVYVYLGHAGLAALDRDDGGVRWHVDLGEVPDDAPKPTNTVTRNGQVLTLRWGSAGSPLLVGDLVIVNASEQSNAIRAHSRATGELVWERVSSNLEGCATSPGLAGEGDDQVVVIVLGGEVWALDPRTGKERWSVETGTRGGMSPSPICDARHVYTFGGRGKSHALRLGAVPAAEAAAGKAGDTTEDGEKAEPVDPRVAWLSLNSDIPSPVLHDGLLIAVSQTGMAVALNAENGDAVFRGRLDGRTGGIYASPVVAAGRLYVVSREKGCYVYAADKELKLLATNRIESDGGRFHGSPAVAGDTLFLRSDRFLYRVSGG